MKELLSHNRVLSDLSSPLCSTNNTLFPLIQLHQILRHALQIVLDQSHPIEVILPNDAHQRDVRNGMIEIHHILPLRLLQSIPHSLLSLFLHDRRHRRLFQLPPHFVLQLQRVRRRQRGRGRPVGPTVDSDELQNDVDAVAAELVEAAFVRRAVHRDAQLAERVEEVHFAHAAALRQRVQKVLNVRAARQDALHTLAYAVENRVVVDGCAVEARGDAHIEIGELLGDHRLHRLLKVYTSHGSNWKAPCCSLVGEISLLWKKTERCRSLASLSNWRRSLSPERLGAWNPLYFVYIFYKIILSVSSYF